METLGWSGPSDEAILLAALDEELEQYRLLAYLQRVEADYLAHKLYPRLDELRTRVAQLRTLQARSDELLGRLPREVIGLDLRNGELVRAQAAMDERLRAIEASLTFAMPRLRQALERGWGLREELSGRIHCTPVGLLPLSTREGYLLLRQGDEAVVYDYTLPLLRDTDADAQYHSVRTRYVCTCTVGLGHTYEHIKAELVRGTWRSPNPATFVFESDIRLPRIETFMPLAKQLVYELIGHGAA